ncbi:MAG: alanine dehydrogenase [Bacteroidaceae bacterium]|nr:alanine dehydrogenase [Bacteroidaceae bacterium]
MIIGIPKEIKDNEFRVGMTPAGVSEMVKHNHIVYVQHTAGDGSGFTDKEYTEAGAKILPKMEDIYATAEMIVKVKEPIEPEYKLIREKQLLFTYFHFASDKPLTEAMLKAKPICLAYETVEKPDHSLPLLIPMSEIAGRMAIQEGARFMTKPLGGRGILLSRIPGVKPAKILILGAGIVGSGAAELAAGFGADITITDINLPRLRYLNEILPKNVKTVYSSETNIRKELPDTDLVIGSVLIPGDKTPHLITRDMLKLMKPGTVIVDVAIDQGGCFETSHPTTHSNPVYTLDGIIHYAVANIPGAVPHSSTVSLTNATLPYALALANKGWKKACKEDLALANGLNMIEGKITFKAVADVYDLKYEPISL